MAVKPKLALIPSGVKANKVYSVLPSDGVGDFDFSRSGSATRINKDGLIETVASNVPRLNYPLIDGVVSGCPSLLLEPQRTNLIQYSEAFNNDAYWIKPQASVVSGQSSPSGDTNAFKLVEDTSNNFHWLLQSSVLSTAGTWSYSIFAKAGERDYISMGNASGSFYSFFDLQNGTVVSSDVNAVGSIEEFINGWYRCTVKLTITGATSIGVFISTDGTTTNYQGDGTSGVYIYGAQLEQGSYATSYIPTQGSIGTRVAETCEQKATSNIITQAEGTLYWSGNLNNLASYSNLISLSGGGGSWVYVLSYSSGLTFEIKSNYATSLSFNPSGYAEGFYKIAISYSGSEAVIYINGILAHTDNSVVIPSFSTLNIGEWSGYGQSKETKEVKLYNTRLSNAELQALTKI